MRGRGCLTVAWLSRQIIQNLPVPKSQKTAFNDSPSPRPASLVPVKIGSGIGPSFAANLADEAGLEIRQSDFIRPLIGEHRDGMAALEVRAIDQETADA